MPKSNSYAAQITTAQTMKAALQTNLGTLEKRGMTSEFIETLDETLVEVVDLNSKQERLKGELKSITASLEVAKTQLHVQMVEAVKVVKLEMPKERWIEFGITSKR